VGGVTLLLLVSLVLTGAPALGRTADLGQLTGPAGGPEHRLTNVQRTEVRAARRDHARPQIKPTGGAVIAPVRVTALRPTAQVGALPSAPPAARPPTAGRVRVALLNLPPPAV
jgi:hypothetical protein